MVREAEANITLREDSSSVTAPSSFCKIPRFISPLHARIFTSAPPRISPQIRGISRCARVPYEVLPRIL